MIVSTISKYWLVPFSLCEGKGGDQKVAPNQEQDLQVYIHDGLCQLEGQPQTIQVVLYSRQAEEAESSKRGAGREDGHLHCIRVDQPQQDHQGVHDSLGCSNNNTSLTFRF